MVFKMFIKDIQLLLQKKYSIIKEKQKGQ